MKIIEEIRIAGSTDGSPIANIGGSLGLLFLKYMGNYSMDNEINVLVIQTSLKKQSDEFEILLNDVNTYNLYFIYTRISETYFNLLSNHEKIEFICKSIYISLLEWAKKFNLPEEPIHIANKIIIEKEYFTETSKKYKSKNKQYTAGIEYRYEFDLVTYRLIILDNKTNEESRFFICNKQYFKDNELMKTDYMKWLKTPRTLKVTGWINENEFEMYWGEEKYVFNSDKKEIKIA